MEGFLTFCKQNPDNDWDFVLVGAYSEEFLSDIRNITDKYAGFADRIILIGAVYDRMELAKLYEESALFLFASLSESFGFVYLEALSNKCFIISTPLNPCKEITDNWKYAAVFNYQNPDDLAVKIKETIGKDDLEKLTEEGAEYVYSKYYWPIIIDKLNNKLLKL
ncbi:glycosyltransferase [Chryseobacterium sp. SL1]|nr:glycosyltransferase [Chryseobacterium sp. SL1]